MGAWVSSPGNDDEPARAAGDVRRGLRRLPLKLRLLLAIPLVAVLFAAIAIASALIAYTIRFPDPMALRKRDAAPVVRVLARDGTVLVERGQGGGYIPIDLIPRHLIDAVVATEDRRFFDHWGVDPWGLVRATFANLRAGRYAQGGSTLTQQLAKNLFLSSERTMGRKLEELLVSIWLEVRLSKQDILELYLNRVYFGGGAYGIESASHRYFGKGARNLDMAEAAILAGLLKAPSKFSPLANPGLARARGRSVLRKMADAGLIASAEEQVATRVSVRFADPETGRETHGLDYAIEFALERLPPLAGTGQREIIVETTLEAALQRHAQSVVERTLAKHGAEAGASQAALVVLDTDGGIRAMVGGRSFAQSQFNRATRASRQPGSTFKPLVYLTAIEQGATPETQVLDAPVSLGGWSPRNDNGQHRGLVTLRHALAHSSNTVAVRVQQDVGLRRVIATARRLGIKSELRPDASLALGTSEVTLLELSGAYAMLASGGLAVEPHAIRKVRTAAGEIIYQRPPPRPRMVVAPDHAGAVSSMLHTALASGTGRRAALPRMPAAGKTGTSQEHRDAWFIGYTAHLAGGVWVGNDSGEPMNRVTGGGLSAGIWREVMQEAHAKLPWLPLPGVEETREEKPAPTEAPVARAPKPSPAAERRPRTEVSRAPQVPKVIGKTDAPRPQPPAPAIAAGPAPQPLAIEPEPTIRALVTTPVPEPSASVERDAIARLLAGDPPPARMGFGSRK